MGVTRLQVFNLMTCKLQAIELAPQRVNFVFRNNASCSADASLHCRFDDWIE
jgi:hypothetical protein